MPFRKGETGNRTGRPRGARNIATREMKQFLAWLDSPEYRENAKARILDGRAPHLEVLWHHYHKGKPKDTVRHEGALPAFRLIEDAADDA